MSEQEAFEQAITKHIVSNKLKAFALEKLPNGTYKNNFTKAKLDGWQYATTEANKRIEALEGEVAELKRDRDEWKDSTISANCRFEIAENDVYKYQVETANMSLEIMQLQKNNHDLREALENIVNTFYEETDVAWMRQCYDLMESGKQTLSTTPVQD